MHRLTAGLRAALALFVSALAVSANTIPTYFVGNSVTDTINYAGLQALAQARGHTLPFGRHMIPGAPLEFIWNNASSGFSESPFGYYPNALGNYTWSALSLQPFDRSLASDLDYIKRYTDLALPKSPNLTLFLYARWPRTGDDYAVRWARQPNEANGNEGRAFFEQLTQNVRAAYPGRNVFMVPVGHVMAELHARMKAGQVPGLTDIHQFYSDGIHLDNRGQYLVALTFYTTFFRDDPRGLPVPAQYGTIDPGLVAIIQDAVLDVVAAHPLSGVVLSLPFEVGTSVLRPAIQNTAYSVTLDANFGTAPFTWSVVGGALPAGLSLAANGTLSGTPTALGAASFTLRVTDSASPARSAEAALTLSVEEDTTPAISTASALPGGRVGTPYFLGFSGFAASGGNGAYTWAIASGSLPPGLSLSSGGEIIGAPRATGDYSFTVRVTDADATPDSSTKDFTLNIAAPAADTLTARKLEADLRIDGLLDESFWSLTRELGGAAGSGEPGRNQGARYDVVWDHAYLYLAARVTDSVLQPGSDSFVGDALHLFLDGLHDREAVFNADDRHFAVCPFGRGAERTGRGDGIVRAARRTASGYDIEIAIPWSNLGLVAVDNLSLGLDLVAADDDRGAGADASLRLGATSLANPSPAAFRSLLLSTVGTGGSRAGLLAYEGFDYTAGALDDRAAGSGWSAAWDVQSSNKTLPGYQVGSTTPLAAPAGLSASTSYAMGGSNYLASGRGFNVSGTGPFGPHLDGGLIGKPGGTIWVSWLARRDSGGSSKLTIHPNGVPFFPDNTGVAVFAENERWRLQAGGSTIDTGVAATAAQTFFMVLRLDYGTTDIATLYINPTSGVEPTTHQARASNLSDARFRSLAWNPGSASGAGSLDEIRVGTSYAAVAPTVETAPVVVAEPASAAVRSGVDLVLGVNLGGSNLAVSWTRDNAALADTGGVLLRRPFLRADAGSYRLTAQNRLGSASSTAFALTAEGFTWAEWRATWFGEDPAGAPNAAPGADGLPNLVKFALGWTPSQVATAPVPLWVEEAGNRFLALRFTLDSAANDVAVAVEGSSDLAQWATLATYQAPDISVLSGGVQVARNAVAARPGVDEITVRAAANSASRYFLRLRAEAGVEVP